MDLARRSLLLGALVSAGCLARPMTPDEARAAVEELVEVSRPEALVGRGLELSTDFEAGRPVDVAAEELVDLWESEVGCAEVVRTTNVVTVDFGLPEDGCLWDGQPRSGVLYLAVERNDEVVEVSHVWQELSDGGVVVAGDALVSWTAGESTRQVVHQLSWSEGRRRGTTTGTRLQRVVDPVAALDGALELDGERDWTRRRGGEWHLDLIAAWWRLDDPVPEGGSAQVVDPEGRKLELAFSRRGADLFEVTATGRRLEADLQVSSTGEVGLVE